MFICWWLAQATPLARSDPPHTSFLPVVLQLLWVQWSLNPSMSSRLNSKFPPFSTCASTLRLFVITVFRSLGVRVLASCKPPFLFGPPCHLTVDGLIGFASFGRVRCPPCIELCLASAPTLPLSTFSIHVFPGVWLKADFGLLFEEVVRRLGPLVALSLIVTDWSHA